MTIPAFFSFIKNKHTTKLHLTAFYVLGNYGSISLLSDLSLTSIEMLFSNFVMPGYGFGFVS